MFNENPYQVEPYGVEWAGVIPATQDDIVYNWLSLSNDDFVITKTNYDSSHILESLTFNRPLTDWIWELNYLFREKVITFEGYVKADTSELLNDELDRIKQILLQPQKNLDIKVNWTIRRAVASCVNPSSMFFREHYNLTIIPINIEFRVVEFFKELTSTNVNLPWKTIDLLEETYNDWSAKADPLITIVFNSALSVNSVVFTNNNSITISETISSWDILIINTKEKEVTINGSQIDYSWIFPRLDPWANSFTLDINGTFNYDFNLAYFNTYL